MWGVQHWVIAARGCLLPILLGANLDNDQAPHMGSLSAMSLFLLAVAVALQAAAATRQPVSMMAVRVRGNASGKQPKSCTRGNIQLQGFAACIELLRDIIAAA